MLRNDDIDCAVANLEEFFEVCLELSGTNTIEMRSLHLRVWLADSRSRYLMLSHHDCALSAADSIKNQT